MLKPDLAAGERLAARYPARSVTTPAGVVTYREAGRGTPLVLLHGIGSQSGSWTGQLDDLAVRFRMLAWDAPGYGGSDALKPAAPAAADYAAVLAAFLDALEVERTVLVASSLGALMAAAFAARWPQRTARLVLLNPAGGYGRAPERERNDKLNARLERLDQLGPTGMAVAPSPGMLSESASAEARALAAWSTAQIRPDGYRQAARMLASGCLLADAPRFAGPVLVAAGSVDTVTPASGCERIALAFPDARFHLLEGVGHLSYLDAPGAVNALIAAFAQQ